MFKLKISSLTALLVLVLSFTFGNIGISYAVTCTGTSIQNCSSLNAPPGSGTSGGQQQSLNCNTIPYKYYQITSSQPKTKLTYCLSCGACSAGVNGCIKGTVGCKACQIKTGGSQGTGSQCTMILSNTCQPQTACTWP
jgi:hypothetical protein